MAEQDALGRALELARGYAASRQSRPVRAGATLYDLRAALGGPLPATPIDSTDVIDALARVMRQGAELRFATDIDDYAGWALGRFLDSPHFGWAAIRAHDWRQPWPEWSPTRYEVKAHSEGRGSAYLTFVRL